MAESPCYPTRGDKRLGARRYAAITCHILKSCGSRDSRIDVMPPTI